MEQHHFKVIYSSEEEIYRIIDLTDTSIVGVTEMYENDDDIDREVRAELNNEIKSHKTLGVKIVGYGVFLFLDDYNTPSNFDNNRDYLQSVLRQMAKFFEQEVIAAHPKAFEKYLIPHRQHSNTERSRKKRSLPQTNDYGFRLLGDGENGLYRIVDVNDTDIVGITEMCETADDKQREHAIRKHNRIKTNADVSAKVPDYGIFINLDTSCSKTQEKGNAYVHEVLKQMASFFKREIINASPAEYKKYFIPKDKRATTVSDPNRIVEVPQKAESAQDTTDVSINHKKRKKSVDGADVFMWIVVGIPMLAIAAGLIWLIVKIASLGIIGTIVFILCAIYFIPEVLKEKR